MHSRRIHSIYAGRRSLPVPHHSEQNRFQKSATWRTQYYTVSSDNIKEDWNKVRFYSGKRFLSGQRHKSHPALLTLRQSVSNGKEDFDLGNDCLSLTIDDTPSQHGTLKIARLEKGDVGAASVVLTRSFAASPQGMVIDDVRSYCERMLTAQPKGLFLVGKLFPNENEQPDWLKPNTDSRIIATAALSFHSDSREQFATLPPPENAAYLCNIAVDPTFRRKGYARTMLAACEKIASSKGFTELYLHLRLVDAAARSLYESSGYNQLNADSWLIKLRGLTPSALMVKRLT